MYNIYIYIYPNTIKNEASQEKTSYYFKSQNSSLNFCHEKYDFLKPKSYYKPYYFF